MAIRAFTLPTTSGVVGPQAPAAAVDASFRYFGHTEVRETAGGSVTATIRDSASATGAILAEIVLSANGVVGGLSWAPTGIVGSGNGAYLHIESGTGLIEGSVILG